jgi:peptide-methionine (S)-S-oxide reductase
MTKFSLAGTGTALLGGGLLLAALVLQAPAMGAEDMHLVPPPAQDVPATPGPQTAVLSGGCFWGVQGVFEHVRGVTHVLAGYSGGSQATANYETVSEGDTGHAESVQITYDPQQISYGHLLQIFFSVALDPTMKNAQGPDSGTQYRSEIWYANPQQQKVAAAYIAQLDAAHTYGAPIATRVDKLTGFYPAEAYHQDFLVKNPDYPYIVYNDIPKVQALQKLFPKDYVAQPKISTAKS